MDMLRHVAKLANTDQRCVVAFMQIPNREDHALVIPIDNLPPRMEQAVMDVLRSPEGQNEETFALALSRNLLPDTGEDILRVLHNTNRLSAVPVSQVLMMPRPNQPIKLSTILEQLGRLPNQQTHGLLDDYAINKFNPHLANQQAENAENNRSIARNLLVEAEMLEGDARRKREQAYSYDLSLRPKTVSSSLDDLAQLPLPITPLAELPPVLPPDELETDKTGELLAIMNKLMERVEEQDKVICALQGRSQESSQKDPEHGADSLSAKDS